MQFTTMQNTWQACKLILCQHITVVHNHKNVICMHDCTQNLICNTQHDHIYAKPAATSIIYTFFIWNLNYPDYNIAGDQKYITMHVQKAWPMIFVGVWLQVEQWVMGSTDLLWPKLTDSVLF